MEFSSGSIHMICYSCRISVLYERSKSSGRYLDMRKTPNSKNFANFFLSEVVSHGDGSLVNRGGSQTSMIPSDSHPIGKYIENFI